MLHCYLDGMEMQEKYYKKWQKIGQNKYILK